MILNVFIMGCLIGFMVDGKVYTITHAMKLHDGGGNAIGNNPTVRKSAVAHGRSSEIDLGDPGFCCSNVRVMRAKRGLLTILVLLAAVAAHGDDIDSMLAKAKDGDVAAQLQAAEMYAAGEGVAKDAAAAELWYLKAAEQGDAVAQYRIGQACATGDGIAKNPVEAVKWLTKSAAQGNTAAQLSLGRLFMSGKGMPKSSAEAAKWFRLAADQGNAAAQCQMARMHLAGAGVLKDDVTAYKWASLAAAQGDKPASQVRLFLGRRMTAAQTAQGQTLVREFQEKMTADDATRGVPRVAPPLE
jgi:TPR repeat protein